MRRPAGRAHPAPRRSRLGRLAAAALLGGSLSCADRGGADVDVLLVVIDTLRADRLGCYGYDRDTSPHIDALAARGVRFADCTAQSSWTGPSMVSLFTGRHVASDFVRLPEGVVSLAERFHRAGFRTAAVQSNPLLFPGSRFERGFEDYLTEPDPPEFEEVIRRDDGRPRFLYVHLVNPHDPYEPAPAFDRFPPRPVDLEMLAAFEEILRRAEPDLPARTIRARAREAERHVARERARYDGEVRMADAIVDRVLSFLPRPERTVVAVASDHGECLWEHRETPSALRPGQEGDPLQVFKQTHNSLLTRNLIHVPLVLAGPGLPEGVVVHAPVENVDLHATLLDLAGLEVPDDIDGRSLVPAARAAARGEAPSGRDVVFSNTQIFSAARSRSGWKLVVPWREDGPERTALYDLRADPFERRPLPPDGEIAHSLRRAIDSFRREALRARGDDALVDPEVRRRLEELGYLGR